MNDSVKVPKSDAEMEDYLKAQDFQRLAIARAAAEKWVGSVTALTGFVGLVTILKGADSTTKLSSDALHEVGLWLGVSFALLVVGVLLTSAAAYGIPFLADSVDRRPDGLLTRVFQQLKTYAALSRLLLTTGLLCVVLGLGALLVASWKTWIPGSSDPPAAESICISVDGAVVAKVKANSLDVEELTGAQLAPCR